MKPEVDSDLVYEDIRKGFEDLKNATGPFHGRRTLHLNRELFYALKEETQVMIKNCYNLLLL